MKTLKQLRKFDLQTSSPVLYFSRVKDLHRKKLDFDVFLPSKDKNLQRPQVWTLEQKRQLIMSIFIERPIPHICAFSLIDPNDERGEDVIQVIDGKQRLTSIIAFYNNEFTVELEGKEYLYKDLPEDYRHAIDYFEIKSQLAYDQHGIPVTDEMKIEWFRRINFFGTPQDQAHLNDLIG